MAKAKTAAKNTEVKSGASLGGERKTPKKDFTVAHVSDANGRIRSYSAQVHGEGFLDLANEFASKVEGRVVEAE